MDQPNRLSRGIQLLLFAAQDNERLLGELVSNPTALADKLAIKLTENERAVLASVSQGQLRAMVRSLGPVVKGEDERRQENCRKSLGHTADMPPGRGAISFDPPLEAVEQTEKARSLWWDRLKRMLLGS